MNYTRAFAALMAAGHQCKRMVCLWIAYCMGLGMILDMFRASGKVFLLLLLFGASPVRAETDSAHVKGPDGLEGWTVSYSPYEKSKIAGTFIIARNGKIIAKFEGDPFIWRWIFLENGKKIAYETGPLHFSMECVLADLSSAKEVERMDCFAYPDNSPQGGWPEWVDKLETSK